MFNRIFTFVDHNFEIIAFFVIALFVMYCLGQLLLNVERTRNIDRNIIEQTEDYVIYDNCREFDDEFYCWND